MNDKPIRWIVDDALSLFSAKAGAAPNTTRYSRPAKFGRGPKGEVWKCINPSAFIELMPGNIERQALFLIITIYAVKASALHLGQALEDVMSNNKGSIENGS